MNDSTKKSVTDVNLLTYGRTKIEIPLSQDELTKENISLYLQEILTTHQKNVRECEYLYNFYKGKQPILNKNKVIREEINKIIVENHAYEIVEFKKGYEFGKPITYAHKDSADNDDIGILNKYMLERNKDAQDLQIGEYMYIMGTAYRWVLPRKDYENIEKEAPFRLITSSPMETFVVYSTRLEKEKLFGGNIVSVFDAKNPKQNKKIISIYTATKYYEFETTDGIDFNFIKENTNGIGKIPVIEYPLNESRLSPIEVVMTMLNALNDITSNELDDVVQFVNSLLIFVNQEVTQELLNEILELGAMQIKTEDATRPADVKELTKKLEHNDINTLFERIYGKMLGIIGVPKTSDSPRSSGDTGQARLLGEGWTLADQRASSDEKMFDTAEHKMLKVVLSICKKIKNCPIQDIYTSDIEIKHNRNKDDNLLVKTQSLTNLNSAGLPKEIIAQAVNLFSDPHEVAEKWQKEADKNREEMFKINSKAVSSDTQENISKENKNSSNEQNIKN